MKSGKQIQIVLRLPYELLHKIEAISRTVDRSRNKILVAAIGAGAEYVVKKKKVIDPFTVRRR